MAEIAKVEVLPTGEYEMTLVISHHPDPALWGIVMADMLRHLANAYHAHQKAPKELVVERILKVFRAEMSDDSSRGNPRGEMKNDAPPPRKPDEPS